MNAEVKVTIDTSVVSGWVDVVARQVADNWNPYIDEPCNIYEDADTFVEKFMDSPEKALTIIAAYGYENALIGYSEEEYTPQELFGDDVAHRAQELIVNEYNEHDIFLG